jgi:hypothetical protein
MLNRDTFQTDPTQYRLANQGVAKISYPPPAETLDTLHGELSTFVCDGAYANGLARILEAFLGSAGKKGINTPAVWISGFYGSGKSHLASMLAALWTNLRFPDGATAEGLIPHLPHEVTAPLKELRIAATRMGGTIAARPIPMLAPVTSAFRPSNLMSMAAPPYYNSRSALNCAT